MEGRGARAVSVPAGRSDGPEAQFPAPRGGGRRGPRSARRGAADCADLPEGFTTFSTGGLYSKGFQGAWTFVSLEAEAQLARRVAESVNLVLVGLVHGKKALRGLEVGRGKAFGPSGQTPANPSRRIAAIGRISVTGDSVTADSGRSAANPQDSPESAVATAAPLDPRRLRSGFAGREYEDRAKGLSKTP